MEYYPCHYNNKYYKYYKGEKSIINGKCKQCEWDKWMGYFIERLKEVEGKRYALERCLDVEKRDSSQPEALFVNIDNEDEKMVLEIKELREVYGNDNIKTARNYLENLFMKKVVKEMTERIAKFIVDKDQDNIFNEFLKKGNTDEIMAIYDMLKVIDNHEQGIIEKIFTDGFKYYGIGLQLCMYTNKKEKIKSPNETEDIVSRTVPEVIFGYGKKKRNKLESEVAREIAEYIITNILASMHMQKGLFRQTKEFEIYDISFEVGKSMEDDSLLSLKWIELGGVSQYYSTNGYKEEVKRLYKKCENEFSREEYKSYKKVFVLVNNNSKDDETIVKKVLKDIEQPKYIDEIWVLANRIEEYWNDDINDIDEKVTEISCIKLES